MHFTSITVLASTLLASPLHDVEISSVVEVSPVATEPDGSEIINLAICLDTSGSMKGLIDAARTKLWEIVNDLALAEPTPDLRVALLTYGNNGHDPARGWVHVQTDFTTDLDLVSALSTDGGDEYVGRVVHLATKELSWHPSTDALKLVIVAGNESADQDQEVSFRDACRNAIGREIMVNAIYCGNPADEIAPTWREVAMLADGKFASIDQNEGTIVIATPFDDELARLSTEVNGTYVAWTADGKQAQEQQWVQDANAANLNSAACAGRAMTKGSAAAYRCAWDLVASSRETSFDWGALVDEEPDVERMGERGGVGDLASDVDRLVREPQPPLELVGEEQRMGQAPHHLGSEGVAPAAASLERLF